MDKSIIHPRSIDQMESELLQQLSNFGYADGTKSNYQNIIGAIRVFMRENGLTEYTTRIGQLWLQSASNKNPCGQCWGRIRKCVVRRLDDILLGHQFSYRSPRILHDVPDEFRSLFKLYIQNVNNRHQALNTLLQKERESSYFFNDIYSLGCRTIETLDGETVSKASLMHYSASYPKTIRDVLGFLQEEGFIQHNFSPLVRKVKRKQPSPSVYTKDERLLLENSPDLATVKGKRDRAVILLATRNGLREGNIARLKLSDIDYENNVIHIDRQVKTYHQINPVLFPEVKCALEDYIKNARPDVESEYVFIRTLAPFNPINGIGVNHIISDSIQRLNIKPNGRHIGPHAMRSSLTSSGINNGMTYEEMRVVNGHRSANAIKHYARLDDNSLRKCALDVPEPSGRFFRLLQGKEILSHDE